VESGHGECGRLGSLSKEQEDEKMKREYIVVIDRSRYRLILQELSKVFVSIPRTPFQPLIPI
jgi:hypothetical protein